MESNKKKYKFVYRHNNRTSQNIKQQEGNWKCRSSVAIWEYNVRKYNSQTIITSNCYSKTRVTITSGPKRPYYQTINIIMKIVWPLRLRKMPKTQLPWSLLDLETTATITRKHFTNTLQTCFELKTNHIKQNQNNYTIYFKHVIIIIWRNNMEKIWRGFHQKKRQRKNQQKAWYYVQFYNLI